MDVWTIHTDGGSRGNPGPAAYAYVIERPGDETIDGKGYLGKTTNNIAEYTALVKALEHAQKLGGKKLLVQSDSELMVHQMNGVYKVKNPGIFELYAEAKDLCRQFDAVTFRHVRREHNKDADMLCNQVLDDAAQGIIPPPETLAEVMDQAPAPKPKKTKAEPADRARRFRERATARLFQAAAQWGRSKATEPEPATVIEEIWEMLRQEGLLR